MFRTTLVLFMSVATTTIAADPERKPFGTMPDGTVIEQFILKNDKGMVAKFINYGGIITELHVPDKNGKTADVVLGFDNLKSYLDGHPYFGCITGRVANRIAKGKFTLDGKEYTLATNNGPNHLHGGDKGFDKKVWKGEFVGKNAVKFTYRSPDGEEGYPGNLDVAVMYGLWDCAWGVLYVATTDKATPINLTQHAYFNLGGHANGDIGNHDLRLWAAKYTPSDSTLLPTGELKGVKGTPFDFTVGKLIGKDLKAAGGEPIGFDHNFIIDPSEMPINKQETPEYWPDKKAARLKDLKSGRVMDVLTTEPGLQLYTGNFLDGKLKGKGGAVYKQYSGVCLEAQHFPNAINTPAFKSIVLKPGDTYRQTTVYKFSAE